ncbi:aldehyde dehydrogenase family protein, partial [bacterium]|nr:aldehyde dehydrogenase family protein [bacterium]
MENLNIDEIVQEVLRRIREKEASAASSTAGAPVSVDSLVARARQAQKQYQSMGLEVRRKVVENMRRIALDHADELGNMAVSETGLGKMPDKREKVILAATKTPGVEDLVPRTFTGDHGLTLEELAPYGVVVSITPSTNLPSTIVNNSISIVAAGNAVIFNPHPAARQVSAKAAEYMRRALADAGAPTDVVQYVPEPTIETANQLMYHPDVDLIVVTGGEGVVNAALKVPKKSVCAGPGNPP